MSQATATYRRTKQGEWVVMAPQYQLHAGMTIEVATKDGRTKTERIVRVGKGFLVAGTPMAYGYLAPKAAAPATAPHRSRRSSCPTGGNCSSFGDGRSCGADDCDGW